MTTENTALTPQEHRAILCLCILAAFADGNQDDRERSRISAIANGFAGESLDVASTYQDVLSGKVTLESAAAELSTPEARALGYEMALCVCQADNVLVPGEQEFLNRLRAALKLSPEHVQAPHQSAGALIQQPLSTPLPPVIGASQDTELERLILNTSILTGALELMPHTLATMAIVPVQIRMVYQIGKRYGFELDRRHITEFLATVGVGLGSQVFEGFARKLVRGFSRRIAGGLIGGLAGQAAGSAFAFASTYALGHLANHYYSSGRSLTTEQLRSTFSMLLDRARGIQNQYTPEILKQSQQTRLTDLLPLTK